MTGLFWNKAFHPSLIEEDDYRLEQEQLVSQKQYSGNRQFKIPYIFPDSWFVFLAEREGKRQETRWACHASQDETMSCLSVRSVCGSYTNQENIT
jgi:hypothetical protein